MSKKALLLFLAASLLLPLIVHKIYSQSGHPAFSMRFAGGLQLPLGRDSDIFNVGPQFDVKADYHLVLSSPLLLSFMGGIGYGLTPIPIDNSVSTIYADIGMGLGLQMFDRVLVSLYGNGGYFYSLLNQPDQVELGSGEKPFGGNLLLGAGLNVTYLLYPAMGLGLDIAYRNHLGFEHGLVFRLSAAVYPKTGNREDDLKDEIQLLREEIESQSQGEITGPEVELVSVNLDSVFPVFHTYYDNHPLGKAVLHNQSQSTAENVKITLFIKRYMDDPKVLFLEQSLEAGQQASLDLYGLFTDSILDVTEGTKVSANITVEYQLGESTRRREYIETLRIQNRNAVIWDDDRKAAAFVTSKDPVVQRIAKNVAGMIERSQRNTVISNLHTALVLYEALAVLGISYQIDPITPYQDFSKQKTELDYLQFPSQTLAYKAGDCDDLSILYNSVLEAVGIETAFVTTPGHIFSAFCLDLDHGEAWKIFHEPDDLIFEANRIWIPVEITQVGSGFLKSWQTAAREWREFAPLGGAGF